MGGPVRREEARDLVAKGMQFFTIGGDWGFLTGLADQTLSQFREISAE